MPLSPEHGGGVCATYRCDGGTTKLALKARTTEGDYGDVRLTVVARTPPKKSAQVCARFRFTTIFHLMYVLYKSGVAVGWSGGT